jgi:pimeloyl-ACP methyl ester carboxylesterase
MAVTSRDGTSGGAREQTRARYPDETGFIERDGVRVFWERYGDGSPTILLMPSWSIVHSRLWKGQIPYLARHFRVVAFDGRGNGRSDRPPDAAAYADTEFAADGLAILDATGTDRAVVVGLSMGAGFALRLAVTAPERVMGLVLFGPSVPVLDRAADAPEDAAGTTFDQPKPDDEDWHKYNGPFWRRDWSGFARWFAGEKIYSEPHSTKQVEDTIGWMRETDPETIIATEHAPYLVHSADWEAGPPTEGRGLEFARRVRCPAVVVHGTDDHVIPFEVGRRLAATLGAPLVVVEAGGHSPIGRDPVLANLIIRDFVRGLEPPP